MLIDDSWHRQKIRLETISVKNINSGAILHDNSSETFTWYIPCPRFAVGWVSWSVNSADISRAITSGHHPYLDPAGFARAVDRIQTERGRQNDELRLTSLTRGRGFALARVWKCASQALRDIRAEAPAWLGNIVSVQEWTRDGCDPIFIFRAHAHSGDLRAFQLRSSGRWVRVA